MQKEKILSELYHGNINPMAKSVVQDIGLSHDRSVPFSFAGGVCNRCRAEMLAVFCKKVVVKKQKSEQ